MIALLHHAFRRVEVVRFGLWLIVGIALLTGAVYVTGRRTVDVIGNVQGVALDRIEPHEHAAGWALGTTTLAGLAAAVTLFVSRRERTAPRPLLAFVLAITLAALAVVIRTSLFGGRIHHPETGGERSTIELPPVEPQTQR